MFRCCLTKEHAYLTDLYRRWSVQRSSIIANEREAHTCMLTISRELMMWYRGECVRMTRLFRISGRRNDAPSKWRPRAFHQRTYTWYGLGRETQISDQMRKANDSDIDSNCEFFRTVSEYALGSFLKYYRLMLERLLLDHDALRKIIKSDGFQVSNTWSLHSTLNTYDNEIKP